MAAEFKSKDEQIPFKGAKVYFSGSIKGVLNQDPDFAWNLVQFILEGGAEVLDQNVAGRTKEEMRELFIRDNGFDADNIENPWCEVEEVDIEQVDRATHIVALVNGPSHGVGNEIQRAIDKPAMGLTETQLLCLIEEGKEGHLSWMIRGKQKPKYPNFKLKVYKDLEDAKRIIYDFLLRQ